MGVRHEQETLLQEVLQKTVSDSSLNAGTGGHGLAWLLLVHVEGVSLPGMSIKHHLQIRAKYGETDAYEELTIRESGSIASPQTRGEFRTSCAFAWCKDIAPILRFNIRYDKFMARTLAKAQLQIPFCESRLGGWLVWPGVLETDVDLLHGTGLGKAIGSMKVLVEMRGIPKAMLSLGHRDSGLPAKMLLQVRAKELQGSVLVIGSATDSTDDDIHHTKQRDSTVVMGHPADQSHLEVEPETEKACKMKL